MVRDIGDTTVQLSWSRGFDNHSPIAKYTLQARTPPAGKWKQVRTSKCELPPGTVSPDKAWLCAGSGDGAPKAGAEAGASQRDKLGPSACRELPGQRGHGSHGQPESRVRTGGGRARSAPLKHWQEYHWGDDHTRGGVGCADTSKGSGQGGLRVFWSLLKEVLNT